MYKFIFVNLLCVAIFAVFSFVFPAGTKALDYQVDLEFDINLLDNGTAGATQKVKITNNSPEFLSTSLSLDFPFSSVESLQVESDGDPIPASIDNGRLWIEFKEKALNHSEQKELLIKYRIPDFVENYGSVNGMKWPKFNIEGEDASYPVRISYPINWEDVLYSSQGVDLNVVFETKRAIAFTQVSKPLSVFVGKYTLKQLQLSIKKEILSTGATELEIPIREGFYISGVNDSTKVTGSEGSTVATIDLKNHSERTGVELMKKPEEEFKENVSLNDYSEGLEKITGIDTNDPSRLYKILLARLTPNTNITGWSRNTVTDILSAQTHTDLDYANVLTNVFRSKGIPAQIVYGIVKFPDGNYYWHFWVAYLDKDSNAETWKQIDPYIEAVSGENNFQSITPVRIVWGELADNSDLSDLGIDLFSIEPKNFQFRFFPNSSAQTGYITSQLNNQTLSIKDESILGDSSYRVPRDRNLLLSVVFVAAGMGMLLIASYVYKYQKSRSI